MTEEQKINNRLKSMFYIFSTFANLRFADASDWKDEHIKLELVLCKPAKISAATIVIAFR